jgi:hypothetical protein
MVCDRITLVVRAVISDVKHFFVKGRSTVSNLVQITIGVTGEIEDGWQVDDRLFQGFRQGASRSNEVRFVNFICWGTFVLDVVLSDSHDRSKTTCQIGGLFFRIDSMSFRGFAGESVRTDILHFVY